MKKVYSNEQINWIKDCLNNNSRIKGKVKSFQEYGAFINLRDNIDGLLPLKNISVTRIKHPEEVLKKGEEIDIIITEFDEVNNRITVSHKECLGTWEENIKQFEVGKSYIGTIRGTTRGGIFIELMPNLVGLAEHKSGFSYGEKVEVLIKKISPEKQKIKLIILD